MAVGLAEAARLTGRNQSTIHRAMKTGKLSFTRTPAGERQIEIAELERVFPLRGAMAQAVQSHSAQAGESVPALQLIEHQAATIADLHATIRDLQRRLDAESEERRRVQERLTGLLTHRQAGSVPATGSADVSDVRRPWWRRWRRWRLQSGWGAKGHQTGPATPAVRQW
jgi:hypothetical protein